MQITLRAARVNRGLSQVEVAKIIGKNKDTINRYEKNSSKIPRDTIVKLLDLYGFSHDDIFFGKESDFIEKITERSKK